MRDYEIAWSSPSRRTLATMPEKIATANPGQ
jgi:hypothetical protein